MADDRCCASTKAHSARARGRSRRGSHDEPRLGRGSARAASPIPPARASAPSSRSMPMRRARRRMRRTGCARPAISPRRSPACRSRSRTSSTSPASARWPARGRSTTRRRPTADAPIVARLKAAGAVIVGRTNMTEFAFSGVGINPHYGTPGNPCDRSRIPGGSSSGAPVSVADGMAAVAIGTDTGGSVRIPAALCGLVGFKPTQYRVPRDGAVPLSTTLELDRPDRRQRRVLRADRRGHGRRACRGAGAVRPTACASASRRLSARRPRCASRRRLRARGFALSRAGARIVELPLEMLGDYRRINVKGGFRRWPKRSPGTSS